MESCTNGWFDLYRPYGMQAMSAYSAMYSRSAQAILARLSGIRGGR